MEAQRLTSLAGTMSVRLPNQLQACGGPSALVTQPLGLVTTHGRSCLLENSGLLSGSSAGVQMAPRRRQMPSVPLLGS